MKRKNDSLIPLQDPATKKPKTTSDKKDIYQKGMEHFVQSDYKTAVKYFEEAAPYPPSLLFLYCIFEYGFGHPKNQRKSLHWKTQLIGNSEWFVNQAADGESQSLSNLGFVYQKGLAGIAKNPQQGIEYFRLSADKGNPIGLYNLGYCYQNATGLSETDLKKAFEYYHLAAEQGFAVGQHVIGMFYERGLGIPSDPKQAAHYYKSSADQGYGDAQSNLSFLFKMGNGVAKDLNLARRYSELAADQNQGFTVPEGYRVGSRSSCYRVKEVCLLILIFKARSYLFLPELWEKVTGLLLESQAFKLKPEI